VLPAKGWILATGMIQRGGCYASTKNYPLLQD